MILKRNSRAGVVWERCGVKHRVVAGGELLIETTVEAAAQITYEEAVRERDPAIKMREAERAHFDVESARWEGFGVRSTKNKGKGGKGGRGGV